MQYETETRYRSSLYKCHLKIMNIEKINHSNKGIIEEIIKRLKQLSED